VKPAYEGEMSRNSKCKSRTVVVIISEKEEVKTGVGMLKDSRGR